MRKSAGVNATSSGSTSGTNARRGVPGLSSTGRNIVGAPKAQPESRGGAGSTPTRPSSRGGNGIADTINSARRLVTSSTEAPKASATKCIQPQTVAAPAPELDNDLREAVLSVFKWCDADEDGILNAAEYAAAQRLIAELCPVDFDDAAARSIFESAGDGSTLSLVDEDGFLRAMQVLINALSIPRRQLLNGLRRQTSKRSSQFDRSVSDFQQALVRNTSNIPDTSELGAPPPLQLWRTETGGNTFSLPAGAANGPLPAQFAFKLLQFLGMKTEDSSFIDGELAAKMMGHRHMFRDILVMCGDIKGVHVNSGPGIAGTVDVYLAKSLTAEQMFRVRVSGMQIQSSPVPKLVRMEGFEPSSVDSTDVPPALLTEMEMAEMAGGQSSDKPFGIAALGQVAPPPPGGISRQTSLMTDADLQNADVVLTARPVGRHLFRVRFKLADSPAAQAIGAAPNYILIVPRLKGANTGHSRYADHDIRLVIPGVGMQPQVFDHSNFIFANIRGHTLPRLVVEHEFTSCQVRVQNRSAARPGDIVPTPRLSPEERALNLADDVVQAQRLRNLLESQGLGRRPGERDIAYAVRLGRALCNGYEYDVDITEAHVKNLTSLIWEHRRGDCSAFNAGFVYALRSYGVPARVCLGFKYGKAVKQACGAVVAPHAEAEFYAEGIGWVPCDATLGLKRLGHDGGTALTFVEWRPANMSLEEVEEMAEVFVSPQMVHATLQRQLEDLTGGDSATSKELAHVVSKVSGLTKDSAQQNVDQVIKLSGLEAKPATSIKQFARAWAAVQLGKFSELGAGGGLPSTSKAGAKFYEGGPFKDKPLEQSRLRENMMVPDDVEQVMQTVGSTPPVKHDWSSMWPWGVFLCNYEFEEKPLP